MAAVLWAVLWLVGIVLALAATVLALPVTLGLRLQSAPRPRTRVFVGLLGGVAPKLVAHDSWAEPKKKKQRKAERARQKKRKGRREKAPSVPRWLPRMIRAAPRLLIGLVRPIRLTRLSLDADIGLGDPADTGQLYGAIEALLRPLPLPSLATVAIRPDFTGPRAEGTLDAEIRFVPVAFVPPLVAFGWRVFGWRR